MNSLIRRIERLEQLHSPKDSLTVFIYRWLGDGPIVRATCGGCDLMRTDGESEDDFVERSELWAREIPGQTWGRTVWLSREQMQ